MTPLHFCKSKIGEPVRYPKDRENICLMLCNVKLIALRFLIKQKNDTIER